MTRGTRWFLFLLFFASGFSSLVYQVVWTRMAFAAFGIITPVLSVVLSVFMLGLALGSWAAGRCVTDWVKRTGYSAIFFYAAAEALIGVGAVAVPWLFALGQHQLLSAGQMDSFGYLAVSALVLAGSILPWCVCMGATFPLMMAFVRERDATFADSFSHLYLANVLGAMSGTLLTAVVLVELLGFGHTLSVAAAGNFGAALFSAWLGRKQGSPSNPLPAPAAPAANPAPAASTTGAEARRIKWLLFATGLGSMAMEVVWSRAFTPILRTEVYSFAAVVFAYLGATFVGSALYRRDLKRGHLKSTAALIALVAVAVFVPILANDMRFLKVGTASRIDLPSALLLLASICPFCAALGYLTPRLIDQYAAGQPGTAGRAYALNVLGCILGPLLASYVLLPFLGERPALLLLALPFLLFLPGVWREFTAVQRGGWVAALVLALAWAGLGSRNFEEQRAAKYPGTEVRRDHVASVIATGQGRERLLLVNGIGMTTLTPITKFMVHLPLAHHAGPSQSALIICFGMGTSYRSALSWELSTTAVELVPSVRESFGYYHADAAQVLANPHGHIVIDDGRRFLKRTAEQFDVIVVDPPPPVQAAGSSLLYSDEFYRLAKQRLKPGGILQAWLPRGGDYAMAQAIARSLHDSFPYVRGFGSIEADGAHFLASESPIPKLSGAELAARMPPPARADLLEWETKLDLPAYLDVVLKREFPMDSLLNADPTIRITDDQPYNEYYLLRSWKVISE